MDNVTSATETMTTSSESTSMSSATAGAEASTVVEISTLKLSKKAKSYLQTDDSPTQEELSAVATLREEFAKLEDDGTVNKEFLLKCSDILVIRFIRGHRGDIKKVSSVMKHSAKMRLENDVAHIITKWESDRSALATFFKAYWPLGHIGRDHKGRTVNINLLTSIDFPTAIKELTIEKIAEYSAFLMERNFIRNPHGGSIQITDLGSIPNSPVPSMFGITTWVNGMIAYLKSIATANDVCYPEAFQRIIITRPPALFSGVFAMVKPFLPERTKEKIIILGEKEAFDMLKEYMDESVIPDFLGGKNKLETLGFGGKLPSDFLNNQEFMEKAKNHLASKEEAYERLIIATAPKS